MPKKPKSKKQRPRSVV